MCCGCFQLDIGKAILIGVMVLVVVISFLIVLYIQSISPERDILTAIAVNGDNTQLGTTYIHFSQNEIVEGNAISHEPGASEILIEETGIYQISYQLYGVKDAIGTFQFNAVLVVNNTGLDSTFNESPIIRDSVNRMTLTSTVILKLNEGDVLQLSGVSIEDINYQRARIDIEKIG